MVEVPVAKVTSCCFGGPNLDELFITCASVGFTCKRNQANGVEKQQPVVILSEGRGMRGRVAESVQRHHQQQHQRDYRRGISKRAIHDSGRSTSHSYQSLFRSQSLSHSELDFKGKGNSSESMPKRTRA